MKKLFGQVAGRTLVIMFITFNLFVFQNCSDMGFKVEQKQLLSSNQLSLSTAQIDFSSVPELLNASTNSISFSVNTESGISLKSLNCQLNQNALQDCASKSISLSNLTDGDYILKVIAETQYGVISQNTKMFRRDTKAPAVQVSSQPASTTNQVQANFIFTAMDNLSGVKKIECSLDNQAFYACTSPANLANLSVGARNFRIRAEDQAGNVSALYSYSWTIDLSAPTVILSSTPMALTNQAQANFVFSGQGLVSFECALDSAAFASCTSPQNLTNLTAQNHTFRVRGSNSAGSQSQPAQFAWVVDQTAPSTPALMSTASVLTNIKTANFSFSAMDANGISRYECSLDNAAFATCASPQALNNLADGARNFKVRAVDGDGNTSTTASFGWTIDSILPTAPVLKASVAAQTTAKDVSFEFSSTDAGSGIDRYNCALDGQAQSNCTSPKIYSQLAEGNHAFTVQAIDKAGNISQSSSFSWKIEALVTPPTPTPTPSPSLAKMRASWDDMEAVGPFPSWQNAKSLGAVGNGVADDTNVIQNAIQNIAKPGRPAVVYLPAGTYRITRTLEVRGDDMWGFTLIGENPSNTTILWDGPQDGTMLILNGGFNSRLSRLTWNGNRKAGIGVAHWWNTSQVNLYGGSSQHLDEVYTDMGIGIMAGRMGGEYGQLDSEGEVRRVKFIRNTRAGLTTGSWNALDWWIWDSEFTDCARGVTNEFSADGETGAGNFAVYRSLFQRSTVADVTIGNTQWFSLHNNVSIGSRRFFEGGQIGANSAAIVIQNNRILDTTESISIVNGNVGPITMIDNEIRSRAGVTGPVVSIESSASGQDAISIGNKFTASPTIAKNHTEDRILSINDQVVARTQISSALLTLPPTATNYNRRVFEVAAGASADTIQAAINSAVSSGSDGAIVHLAPGNYDINKTIVIPANKKIQLMGDSIATMFWWNGPADGIILDLPGPSQATVRDIRMIGQNATALRVSQADQNTGRILAIGNSFGPVEIQNVLQTRLDFQATSMMLGLSVHNSKSVLLSASGNIAPFKVTGYSNLHVTDSWYEGSRTDIFRGDSGNFSYIGGHIAPADPVHGGGNTDPAILVNNFDGKVAFVGFSMNTQNSTNGIYIQSEIANTNSLFLGMEANKANYYRRNAGAGQSGLLSAKLYTPNVGSAPISNQGQSSDAFVVSQLEQIRSIGWESAFSNETQTGATNLRLYRVFVQDTKKGLIVNGQ